MVFTDTFLAEIDCTLRSRNAFLDIRLFGKAAAQKNSLPERQGAFQNRQRSVLLTRIACFV
jgi:hypothetical protein